jgi:hypothetical protein
MIDYSGRVAMATQPLMGCFNHLVINLLSSLTTNQADVTDDKNFYDVLASQVQISSIETSLNGHIRLRKTTPIETLSHPLDVFPGACKTNCSNDNAKRCADMS